MDSLSQQITFYALAFFIIVPAVMVTRLRNIFYAGLCLIVSFMGVAGIYLMLNAEFLAAVQVLIYSGAISILILFAIMMTHHLYSKSIVVSNEQKYTALAFVVLLVSMIMVILSVTRWNISLEKPATNVLQTVGSLLMKDYVLPFEVVSVLLLVALVGAVIIARKEEK